jgi:hypothetical protein
MVNPTDVVPHDAESVLDTKGVAPVTFIDAGRVQEAYFAAGTAVLSRLAAKCLEAGRASVRPSTWDDCIVIQWDEPETMEPMGASGLADTSGFSVIAQLSENSRLRHENALLQRGLSEIEQRLARIEAALPEVKVVVLREISRAEAKREIKELFAQGEALDYEDIIDKLSLDLELVVGICNELIDEGEIAPDARPHATG